MSELIRRLNYIKMHRSAAWLTPSQQAAMMKLRRLLQIPQVTNLYGRSGVGKTFLAWHLAEDMQFVYVANPEALPLGNNPVVIDNGHASRRWYRALLKELSFRGIDKAILLTRDLVDDYVSYVKLSVTEDDVQKVVEQLQAVGLSVKWPEEPNLWHLVNPALEEI